MDENDDTIEMNERTYEPTNNMNEIHLILGW